MAATEHRPPAEWFTEVMPSLVTQYRSVRAIMMYPCASVARKKGLEAGRMCIAAGLWWKMTQDQREDWRKRHKLPSGVVNPPASGPNPMETAVGAKYLPCPVCGSANPVSKTQLYVKCNRCGAPLQKVTVRKKPKGRR